MMPENAHTEEAAPLRLAYVLLWFPLASETFIFREICQLLDQGVEVIVFTMYGRALKGCSQKMRDYQAPVTRMGIAATIPILLSFITTFFREPGRTWRLMRRGLFRRMRNVEALAENTWCFFAGFLLARKCLEAKIDLIHSAWANGPATAAWVASSLSGIPFAFTGRAGDIYPEDGILAEKAGDALFIRTNNAANVGWLASFVPEGQQGKVRLVYNPLDFSHSTKAARHPATPPYRILAVGRFARTKGFPDLFTVMARLKRERFPVQLTLVGDGAWRHRLEAMRRRLGLEELVDMPGFVPNDQLARFMETHDLLVVPSVVHTNGDRDGIPNVIMEALSLGLPVVATDVCGIGEVIRNGQTGLLIAQRDPAALALAIRAMLENGEKAAEMTQAGKELVARMFDPRENSLALLRLYQSAIAGTLDG